MGHLLLISARMVSHRVPLADTVLADGTKVDMALSTMTGLLVFFSKDFRILLFAHFGLHPSICLPIHQGQSHNPFQDALKAPPHSG